MYCESCGTKLPSNAVFCPSCGAAVRDVTATEHTQVRDANGQGNHAHRNTGSAPVKRRTGNATGFQLGKSMTEYEYADFKMKLRNVVIKMIIGAVIGFFIVRVTGGTGLIGTDIFMVYMFACVPYVWCMIPFTALGYVAIIVKIFVSFLLGWIITPISLVYYLVMCRSYEKSHVEDEINPE